MKYNGKELIEMSTEKWDGKPRWMLAWDCVNDVPVKTRIVEWYKNKHGHIIWRDVSCKYWNYCANFPEEESNQTQSIDEMIKILNAYKKGKLIEYRYRNRQMSDSWSFIDPKNPDWDWIHFEFRIYKEPQRRRRMTYEELRNWLKSGKGQWFSEVTTIGVDSIMESDGYVCPLIKIRGWGESEWHEALIEK